LIHSRSARDRVALVVLAALTRWIFRSHFLYDIDSVNFALALGRFDPRVYQPHPPGYFLYVRLGSLAQFLFGDANAALVAVSILAGCATVAMIHLLASDWFGPSAARFAGIVFIVSPLAWFHGTVALTYIVEAFFSALIGYLCWQIVCGVSRWTLPAAVALGLAAGFRQSSLLILAPLFLYSLRNVPRRLAFVSIFALVLTLAGWFVPMVRLSGGVHAYAAALWALWTLVPARQTALVSPLITSLVRALLIVAIFVLASGSAALLAFCSARIPAPPRAPAFTWIWTAPGLLLFTFVYLKFVNSGYLLVLLPPACIWLGARASAWFQSSTLRHPAKFAAIAAALVINILIFVRLPLYCSYLSVRRSQQDLTATLAAIEQLAQPRETLIVGFDAHFQGYRHAGFYLPAYWTLQFPEVPLAPATGVFAMHNRQTELVNLVSVGSFRDFVVFPLPTSDREYSAYMKGIRARFAASDVSVTTQNGIEFLRGPIRSLHLLFPNTVTLDPRGP
jgi:hypothetical protein